MRGPLGALILSLQLILKCCASRGESRFCFDCEDRSNFKAHGEIHGAVTSVIEQDGLSQIGNAISHCGPPLQDAMSCFLMSTILPLKDEDIFFGRSYNHLQY